MQMQKAWHNTIACILFQQETCDELMAMEHSFYFCIVENIVTPLYSAAF